MSKPIRPRLKEQTTMGSPSVGAGGHIDLALGTFDRPGPNPEKDMEKTIVPREMVATQLATDRPPIEDENYVPSSIAELAKAASELAKLVPPDQVKKFYLRLKELADESVERQEITVMDEKNMQESKKSKILKMINEALDDLEEPVGDDVDSPLKDPNRKLVPYPDIIKAHPEEFEDIKPGRRYSAAVKAGTAGLRKIEAMLDQIPEEKLDRIQKIAKDEYIDLFENFLGDEAEPEDIADLKKLPPSELYEMSDSYKFFYKAAFVLPSVDAFDKANRKAVSDMMDEVATKLKPLKVPRTALMTVINQILGFSTRKPQEIKQKYMDAAATGEIRTTEVDMLYKQLMAKYPDIETTSKKKLVDERAKIADKFIDDSLDKYSKMSMEQKENLLHQAFSKMG